VDGVFFVDHPKRVFELPRFANGDPIFQVKLEPRSKVPKWFNRDGLLRSMPSPPEDRSAARLAWQSLHEVGDPTTSQARLADAIIANGGGVVTGAAGTGKSYLQKLLVQKLQEQGHRVVLGAPTHAAAKLMDVRAKTIQHLFYKQKHQRNFWWVVDEAFQAALHHWGQLAAFQLVGCRFVFLGDPFQLPPVADALRHEGADDLVASDLVHSLSRGLRVTLTHYRRGTSPDHFNYFTGLYARVGQRVDREMLLELLGRYGSRPLPPKPDLVLVMSHRSRLAINALVNKRAAPADAMQLFPVSQPTATLDTQPMKIWVGQTLLGAATSKGVLNGVSYTVTAVDPYKVSLALAPEFASTTTLEDDEEEEPPETTVSLEDAGQLLRLQHAMCYYSCQGRTVRSGSVVLLELEHARASMRHIIVALSRVVSPEQLYMASAAEGAALLGQARSALRASGKT
jgi:hypothetical protein